MFKHQHLETQYIVLNGELMAHYGCPKSFKVIETHINRQAVCNFLLVVNSKLGYTLDHF